MDEMIRFIFTKIKRADNENDRQNIGACTEFMYWGSAVNS
jgi:hypothetical protein